MTDGENGNGSASEQQQGQAAATPVVRTKEDRYGAVELGRDAILLANDVQVKKIFVPEWRGSVYIKTLDGIGRDAFEVATIKDGERDLVNIRAKLLACTLCDKDGNLLFSLEDVVALGKKSGTAVAMLYTEAAALNVVTDADVEELAGNSGSEVTSSS